MSHSQHQYDITLCDGIYSFTTIWGITYSAYFVKVPTEDDLPLFSFSFEKVGEEHSVYDPKVKSTICSILEDFFEKEVNAMLFVCEQIDGREKARFKLFDKWYNDYKERFDRIDYCSENIYSSVIMDKGNPLKKQIAFEYLSLMGFLSN